jgi:hypothetical protein
MRYLMTLVAILIGLGAAGCVSSDKKITPSIRADNRRARSATPARHDPFVLPVTSPRIMRKIPKISHR